VPADVHHFLEGAHLLVGDDRDDPVEPSTRRALDAADLTAGRFSVEVTPDDESFSSLLQAALAASNGAYGQDAVELVVVVSAPYLKLTNVTVRTPLANVERVIDVSDGRSVAAFRAVHHGCDIEAFLVTARPLEEQPLAPWRKATWLSRVRFELRTGLEGVGFNILPLTDEERSARSLSPQTLRYVALDESPLEASSTTVVNLYVDSDLLARLKREPRKSWAKAFTDQLAVDVLTAIALRAVGDRAIDEAEWSALQDSLLGALIAMVAGKPGENEDETTRQRQLLLETLRDDPHRFVALIEGALEMRDSAKFIVGGA
jgi:hypothetical protein